MSQNQGTAGAIAEFSALRQEIDTRISLQQQVVALHITAVGIIFSLALSGAARVPVLLVIPFTAYAFIESLASLFRVIQGIARYIDEELSPRVPGGLGWESWLARQGTLTGLNMALHPYYLIFPGISAVSLGVNAYFMFHAGHVSGSYRMMLGLAWVCGIGVGFLSFRTIRSLHIPY
jgi:hypothetical protein